MSEQYDAIAELYREASKVNPFRRHVETFTFLHTLGDVQGLSVLGLTSIRVGVGHARRRRQAPRPG